MAEDDDAGEERYPKPHALDEEAERNPTGPGGGERGQIQERQTGHRARQTGRDDRDQ